MNKVRDVSSGEKLGGGRRRVKEGRRERERKREKREDRELLPLEKHVSF